MNLFHQSKNRSQIIQGSLIAGLLTFGLANAAENTIGTIVCTTESLVEEINACCNSANSKLDVVINLDQSILEIVQNLSFTSMISGIDGIYTAISLVEQCCLTANSKLDEIIIIDNNIYNTVTTIEKYGNGN